MQLLLDAVALRRKPSPQAWNKLLAKQHFRLQRPRCIASLQEKPQRCSLATENEIFPEEVRQLLYGKSRNRYRVLFTIRQNIVYILFVRHTAQALLTDDDIRE